jgi:hypothetical protein
MEDGIVATNDILPIVAVDERTSRPVAVCGTSFLIADGVFVTAWHCVQSALPSGQRYVVLRKRAPNVYDPSPLDGVVQHPSGLPSRNDLLPGDRTEYRSL